MKTTHEEYIELTVESLLLKLSKQLEENSRLKAELDAKQFTIEVADQLLTSEVKKNSQLKADYQMEKIRADRLEKQLTQVNTDLAKMLDFSTPDDDSLNRSAVKHG